LRVFISVFGLHAFAIYSLHADNLQHFGLDGKAECSAYWRSGKLSPPTIVDFIAVIDANTEKKVPEFRLLFQKVVVLPLAQLSFIYLVQCGD
jgi:hypothetical protein